MLLPPSEGGGGLLNAFSDDSDSGENEESESEGDEEEEGEVEDERGVGLMDMIDPELLNERVVINPVVEDVDAEGEWEEDVVMEDAIEGDEQEEGEEEVTPQDAKITTPTSVSISFPPLLSRAPLHH